MDWIRLRLVLVTAAWLVCQVAGLAAAPLVFSYADPASADADLHECCKNLAPGQQCPMHHVPHDESPNPEKDNSDACVMRSACAPTDAALLALAGTLGLLRPVSQLTPSAVAAAIPERSQIVLLHASLPEFPPPRS